MPSELRRSSLSPFMNGGGCLLLPCGKGWAVAPKALSERLLAPCGGLRNGGGRVPGACEEVPPSALPAECSRSCPGAADRVWNGGGCGRPLGDEPLALTTDLAMLRTLPIEPLRNGGGCFFASSASSSSSSMVARRTPTEPLDPLRNGGGVAWTSGSDLFLRLRFPCEPFRINGDSFEASSSSRSESKFTPCSSLESLSKASTAPPFSREGAFALCPSRPEGAVSGGVGEGAGRSPCWGRLCDGMADASSLSSCRACPALEVPSGSLRAGGEGSARAGGTGGARTGGTGSA